MHATEFPEFGMTLVVYTSGRVDYVAWTNEDDDRADDSDSPSDESP